MSVVSPYPADTRWSYRNRRSDYHPTSTLALAWEVYGDPISDDFAPDETSAAELWDRFGQYWDANTKWGYPDGTLHIYWYITGTGDGSDIWSDVADEERDPAPFEGAPFQTYPPDPIYAEDREDFLHWFTWPRHAVTGEPVNFLRLPVLDKAWNETQSDKGGFIQEVTGWKPAPLQSTVNMRQLAAAMGGRVESGVV